LQILSGQAKVAKERAELEKDKADFEHKKEIHLQNLKIERLQMQLAAASAPNSGK
jgi:hypothetical protein